MRHLQPADPTSELSVRLDPEAATPGHFTRAVIAVIAAVSVLIAMPLAYFITASAIFRSTHALVTLYGAALYVPLVIAVVCAIRAVITAFRAREPEEAALLLASSLVVIAALLMILTLGASCLIPRPSL